MVIPSAAVGQFHAAEAVYSERGFRGPSAAVTLALVSQQTDRCVGEGGCGFLKLRPNERACGTIQWLVDVVKTLASIRSSLQWLFAELFEERLFKAALRELSEVEKLTTRDKSIDECAATTEATI